MTRVLSEIWLRQLTSSAVCCALLGSRKALPLRVRRWFADCTIFDMKPRGLGATTVAMAVLNLGSFVGIEWTRRGVVVMVAFGGSAGLRRALVLLAR